MPGPWEKYKKQPQTEAPGPWMKFKSQEPQQAPPQEPGLNAAFDPRNPIASLIGKPALAGYIDAAGGGAPSAMSKGISSEIENNPIPANIGRVAGYFNPATPFSKLMGAVSAPVRAGANALYRGAEALPVGLQTLAKIPTFAAEVPLTAASQQAAVEGAKALTGNGSVDKIKQAAIDPTTLMLGYGLGGLSNVARSAEIPKNAYARFGPLQTQDIKRAEEGGRDIVNEAMRGGYVGGFGRIKNLAKEAQDVAHTKRQQIVDAAEATGGGIIPREQVTLPVRQKMVNMLTQAAPDSEINAAANLTNKYNRVLPENVGPRAMEDFLRGQKNFLRERKTDAGVANLFAGSPAASDLSMRREVISPGLRSQEGQISSALGNNAGAQFRDFGNSYGIAKTVERGANKELASSYGGLKNLGSAIGTPAAYYGDYLLNRTPSLQNLLTIFRNRDQQQSGPALSDAEQEAIIRSLR